MVMTDPGEIAPCSIDVAAAERPDRILIEHENDAFATIVHHQ
jgi:hypothetical protein